MSVSARSERSAPWIEGAVLALIVLAVLALGGEAVRASYHGYLKTSVGEAVLRDGLVPENPHHAGTVLRYYTLYPLFGVLLGRLGPGPLWGFALLNVLAALFFGPALDALGRALRLPFAARRAAFVAAVLGFNGLGWIGFLFADGAPFGDPPVFVTMPMTFAREAFGWDARLQAFLPKYFNVSSHGLTLPFALWALAACVPREGAPSRPARAVLPAAAMLTMNPLIGGITGLVMLAWIAPELARGGWSLRARWIGAALAACVLALPFLLPAFYPAPQGASQSGDPAVGGSPLANAVGPLFFLLVPGVLGALAMERGMRWRWCVAAAVMAAFVLFFEAPEKSEYKMSRVGGLLWALPVGVWAARAIARGGAARLLPWFFALACLPTTVVTTAAYLAWGRASRALPLRAEHGRLTVDESAVEHPVPREILAAERAADPGAVVVMHPRQPGSFAPDGLVQGNALVPVLRHPLFVDLPQIHNEGMTDLVERLDLEHALWTGRGWSAERRELSLPPEAALASIRALFPGRGLLVLNHESAAHVDRTVEAAGGAVLSRAGGYTLWSLPAIVE